MAVWGLMATRVAEVEPQVVTHGTESIEMEASMAARQRLEHHRRAQSAHLGRLGNELAHGLAQRKPAAAAQAAPAPPDRRRHPRTTRTAEPTRRSTSAWGIERG